MKKCYSCLLHRILLFASSPIMVVLGVLASVWFCPSQPALAQQKKAEVSLVEASNFASALKALATRCHVAFVIEGKPLKTDLNSEEVKEILRKGSSADETIKQIADAFDYTALKFSSTVYVLKKRYSAPYDLPFVTFEECRLAIQDVFTLLRPFNAETVSPNEPRLKRFVASLTPEQTQLLQDKELGLPIGQLSPEQREQIWRVVLFLFAQRPLDKVREVESQANCVAGPKAAVGWRTLKDMRLFGYEGFRGGVERPDAATTYFRPLSHPDRVWSLANGALLFPSSQGLSDNADLTAPERPVAPVPSGEVLETVSLRVATSRIDSASRTADKVLRVTVEDALAEKPVTIVHPEATAPETLVRAMASAYGLTIETEEGGTLCIVRCPLPRVQDITALAGALRQAIPEPFLRAIGWQDMLDWESETREIDQRLPELQHALEQAAGNSPLDEKYVAALHKRIAEMASRKSALMAQYHSGKGNTRLMRIQAVKRLRAGLEPLLKDKPSEKIPFLELGAQERAALRLVLMTDLWTAIELRLSPTLPDYITRFDQTILTGGSGSFNVSTRLNGPTTARSGFGLTFSYRNAEGKMIWSGISYNELTPPGKDAGRK
jgi:hypothetical protein